MPTGSGSLVLASHSRHIPLRLKLYMMIRSLAVVAFTLAIATSAHAITLTPLHQSDGMITQVRHACGAGMHMVNGVCNDDCRPPPGPQMSGVGCRARLS